MEQNIIELINEDFLKDRKVPSKNFEYNEKIDFYNLSSIIENDLQNQSKNKSKKNCLIPFDLIRYETQNMDDKETTKCYIGFVEKEGIQDNHNENPNLYIFSQEKKVMPK